ncbi:MAG TPA: ATP-binding protein [Solirubrobacteraceae bacterium]|nr:ATP-binding protein [Solirubrobacteraceae bacterium]
MTALLALLAGFGWAAAALLVRRDGARLELVARASHELRGPLTAAQLALDALAVRGEIDDHAALALDAQLRRARLALEDLTAAPAGERATDRHDDVPVAALLAQLALAWRPVLAARGRRLTVTGAGGGVVVRADRARIAQALSNLLANALEHGAGDVEMRARATGGRVRLEVRDGGGGLRAPLDDLVRRPRKGRGARGRGLAIAAGIAERHGGRLCAGPSPRGAALALELPIAAEPIAWEARS